MPLPNFDQILGTSFIGSSLSCVLFGVLSMQVILYYRHYPSDRLFYKLLVLSVWILEVVDQMFIGHAVYFYTITNYANPLVLLSGKVVWSMILHLTIGSVCGAIVKTCFALRVWRFSNYNRPVTLLVLLGTYGQLGLAIAYTIQAFRIHSFSLIPRLKVLASFSLGTGAITDLVTALALCFFLRRLRTGSKKSNSIVNRLTIYALNTGGVTAAISLTTMILYNIQSRDLRFMITYFQLSKLYAISLLATLNTRSIIRGKGSDRERGRDVSRSFEMVQPATPGSPAFNKRQMEISVHHEISVIADPHYDYADEKSADDHDTLSVPAPAYQKR